MQCPAVGKGAMPLTAPWERHREHTELPQLLEPGDSDRACEIHRFTKYSWMLIPNSKIAPAGRPKRPGFPQWQLTGESAREYTFPLPKNCERRSTATGAAKPCPVSKVLPT